MDASTGAPEHSNDPTHPSDPQHRTWAVCCSGGGIRSASFCLGGLQSLRDHGVIRPDDTTFVAISGGSYVAGAWAAQEARLRERRQPASNGRATPYERGSEEEYRLRNNTHYLAPDTKTRVAAVLSLLYGSVVISAIMLAPVLAASYAWGWALRHMKVLEIGVPAPAEQPTGGRIRAQTEFTVDIGSWWTVPVVIAGIAFIVFLFWRWCESAGRPRYDSIWREQWTTALGWAVGLAAGSAFLILVLPYLVDWLIDRPKDVPQVGWTWVPAPALALVSALVPLASSAVGFLRGRIKARGRERGGRDGGTNERVAGYLETAGGWARRILLPWLALTLVILIILFAVTAWVADSATSDPAESLRWIAVGIGFSLLSRFVFDLSRLSMHDYYRWRLADSYGVYPGAQPNLSDLATKTGADPDTRTGADPDTRTGAGTGEDRTDLVVAAAANITALRERPPGLAACSLTFDPRHVILWQPRGRTLSPAAEAAAPEQTLYAKAAMRDLELIVGRKRLTLFDIIAISGAAVSPLMGRQTRTPLRLPMAIANIRLGVWLPHPTVVANARRALEAEPNPSHPGLWLRWLWYLSPHPFWKQATRRHPEDPTELARATKKYTDREARIWAGLLHLRQKADPGNGHPLPQRVWNGFRAALMYRGLQPNLGLLWAESVGHLSHRGTWLYVTDGGHYENLGLVAAMQRGASNIVVLDGSGDHPHSWSTIGQAQALARIDAGFEITIDPSRMRPPEAQADGQGLADHEVVRPWARGDFERLDGRPCGRIWICKLGWWKDASWDIRSYAASHPDYPGTSTAQQLYDADGFEAYRALGYQAVKTAIEDGGLCRTEARRQDGGEPAGRSQEPAAARYGHPG